ncbi:MAG: hypothetical protein KAI24_23035 [Planctomycetes bacterium]|nr:hypothetical protein [Planctomycetota bacterium]
MTTTIRSGGACAALSVLLTTALAAQGHTVTFTPVSPDGIQTFVVPAGATLLSITVEGAAGGNMSVDPGGRGGRISGDVVLAPGTQLQMIVGRKGQGSNNTTGGGGGGGSYVAIGSGGYADFATPLLVAGGGSGRDSNGLGHGGVALGGTGNGGPAGNVPFLPNGAGGGGILGDGASGGGSTAGGKAAVNGSAGGTADKNGGFGGGAGGRLNRGGGGGGYTGGRGGSTVPPKGGTSFADASLCNVVNTPGVVTGNGSVTIDVHFAQPEVHTFTHTGGLQTFVVPADAAMLRLTVEGAAGGGSNSIVGGRGGRITGNVSLAAGTTLQMLVGQRGQGGGQLLGGGGGGASFVAVGTGGYADFATPLLVAGGGGGRNLTGPAAGGHGGVVLGGSGLGGSHTSVAGSGAGALGDGSNGSIGSGGQAAISGGAGGTGSTYGGYGGGGAGANYRAGGGGGYTGGIAGTSTNNSTGGASFADPSVKAVLNEAGAINYSNGRIRIEVFFLARVEEVGAGCAGDQLKANSLPWIGSTFSATGTGLPGYALVLAVTGFSPTSLPLTVVWPQAGANCDLLVTSDLVDVLVPTNGTVTSSVPLPNDPGLIGLPFLHQMVSLRVNTSLEVLGVTATNALQATIGT